MIPLTYIPENIENEDTVMYSDWSSDKYPIEITYREGDPYPSTEIINIRVKDIFGTSLEDSEALSYSLKIFGVQGSESLFLSLNQTETIAENDTTQEIEVNFNNSAIDSLEYGVNTNVVFCQLVKNLSGGQSETISLFPIPVFLKKYNANEVIFFPTEFVFKYRLESSVWPSAKTINIYGSESTPWMIISTAQYVIAFSSNDDNVEVFQSSGFYFAQGVGPATVQIEVTSAMEGWLPPNVSNPVTEIPIHFYGEGTLDEEDNFYQAGAPIEGKVNISLFENTDAGSIAADPTSLEFHAIRFTEEAQPKNVTVISSETPIVSCPLWLNYELIEEENNVFVYSITPLNTSSIGVGNYFGTIRFKKLSGILASVSVSYFVSEDINLLDLNQYNYTLDERFIEVYSNKENAFADVTVQMNIYDFYNPNPTQVSALLKAPFHNGKSRFNIGRLVDRAMFRLNKDFQSGVQYKFANVKLDIIERNYLTNQATKQLQSEELKYIAGRTPDSINSYFYFLEQKVLRERITPESVIMVNYVAFKLGRIEIYINDEKVYPENLSFAFIQLGINTFVIKAKDLGVKQGDVVSVLLKPSSKLVNAPEPLPHIEPPSVEEMEFEGVSKEFICFPEGKHSFHILWEDKYKLMRCFEFTGSIRIEDEYQESTFTKLSDLVEVFEKISTKKNPKLFLDTGWILSENIDIISDISLSARAWLVDENLNKKLRLVPVSKKQIMIDSEKSLFGYMIEFNINLNYNEENYTSKF